MTKANLLLLAALVLGSSGCGGSTPPPKIEEQPIEDSTPKTSTGPKPQVSQELGSIDQRKVEQTLQSLQQGPIETCHKSGRDRVDVLSGDVKFFLRVDGAGKVRYGYLEDTTIGDRETEKCILESLSRASWPKPEGGEAELHSSFGWGPGGEREPSAWSSDKVSGALVEAKDVKKDVDKCKAGLKADFKVTAYVEHDDSAAESAPKKAGAKPAPAPAAKPKPRPKHGKKGGEHGGKFKAIGMGAPTKEAAEKIDCLVDALKPLELPSPGSYPAKVTFTL